MAGMREVASQVLERWRVPALARKRDARVAEHAALLKSLAHAKHMSPWWERAVFGDVQDSAQIRALEESTARAWEASRVAAHEAATAVSGAASELLPIEIAFRVEQIIASVLADPAVGRAVCEEEAQTIVQLDALAVRVASIWLVDYSPERLTQAVADMARRELVPADGKLLPPERDERFGWAPIDIAQLVTRATAVLASGSAAVARERLRREGAEYAAAAQALKEARDSIGLDQRLWPGRTDDKDRVAGLQRALEKEHGELVGASELLLAEVERALSAFPPLGVYVAATATAGVLRADIKSEEWTLTPQGGCALSASAGPRALLLASLVELRRSVDAAFPGLGALISRRGGAKAKSAGVYRERHTPEEEQHEPLRADETEVRLFEAIERSGAREQIGRALGHAIALGGIGRAADRTSADVGWTDALVFWSPSEEKTELERLEQRRAWHREMVSWLMYDTGARVDQAARVIPGLRMRNHVMNCHRTMNALGTISGTVSSSTMCPVLNREAALMAIHDSAVSLGRTWGLSGTKQELAQQVTRYLGSSQARANPVTIGGPSRVLTHHEVVVAVAETLRSTDFAEREARLRAASVSYSRASAARDAAWGRVTWWDELNVFTDSPAEAELEAAKVEMVRLEPVIRDDYTRINEQLDRALSLYPPASAYFSLVTLQAYVLAVRAALYTVYRNKRTSYYCRIRQKDPALKALRQWTAQALFVFGPLATNGELIESFVASELQTPNDDER
jgi:hypothetical protein